MCVHVLFPSLTSSTYIALHPLCRGGSRIPHRRGCQPSRGAPIYDFAKFCEKLHEIEKILGRRGAYARGAPPKSATVMCTLSIFDIFDIALIFCTVFNAFNVMYLNTSDIKQCALTHIDMRPLMYTQQIR